MGEIRFSVVVVVLFKKFEKNLKIQVFVKAKTTKSNSGKIQDLQIGLGQKNELQN